MAKKGLKITWVHIAVIAMVVLLANEAGYINLGFKLTTVSPPPTGQVYTCPVCGETFATQALLNAHSTSIHGTVTHDAAAVQLTIKDSISGSAITSSGNNKVDVIRADSSGVFDFYAVSTEQIAVTTAPDQGVVQYSDGDKLILHVSSDLDPTGGTDYYDQWYYVTLVVGSPVRRLSDSLLTVVQSSPHYKYSLSGSGEVTGYEVSYTSGTTNYWDVGTLVVIPRTTAANLDIYLSLSGTSITSITDGLTYVTAGSGTDVTLTTTSSDKMKLEIIDGATSVGWGVPMYYVTSSGMFQKRVTVIAMTTSCLNIGVTKLFDQGWKSFSDSSLYAEKGFYYVMPQQVPNKGEKFSFTLEIPLDMTGVSGTSKWMMRFWFIDFQAESNVLAGSISSTIPTAYGCVGEYGIDAMIYARGYSTSSGAGSGEVVSAQFTNV